MKKEDIQVGNIFKILGGYSNRELYYKIIKILIIYQTPKFVKLLNLEDKNISGVYAIKDMLDVDNEWSKVDKPNYKIKIWQI